MNEGQQSRLSIEESGGTHSVTPKGEWTLSKLKEIFGESPPSPISNAKKIIIKGGELTKLDTAGAIFLLSIAGDAPFELEGFKENHKAIAGLVLKGKKPSKEKHRAKRLTLVQRIGESSIEVWGSIQEIVYFLGYTLCELWRSVLHPRLFRIRELFVQIEMACVAAIPIISLVTFLIGVVIAYLFSVQSQKYGANIFIVESIGLAMCRELSPIIVAVVVAGRSGSAYTAQIGTMKLNEEIDALSTLGLSPMQVLVIPRVLALMLAMPILVFVGDVVGIVGGSIIAKLELGITPITFYERLQVKLPLKHLWVGLCKAPVFALFISLIGCRLGMTVENNARSVGLHTTSTVVQSIVSVILLNALFAVILVELKI